MGRHRGRRAPHTFGSTRESGSRGGGEALESARGQGGSSEGGKRKKFRKELVEKENLAMLSLYCNGIGQLGLTGEQSGGPDGTEVRACNPRLVGPAFNTHHRDLRWIRFTRVSGNPESIKKDSDVLSA